jgi:hypothetical protein
VCVFVCVCVCVCVCLNLQTSLPIHKARYERRTTGDHPDAVLCNFLQSVKTTWLTTELPTRKRQHCYSV